MNKKKQDWSQENSPTLRRFRRIVLPTPKGEAVSYWVGPDDDSTLAIASRAGERAAEKFEVAIERRRWPARRPVAHPPPSGWPEPMGEAAYHGLAGDIVRAISPYTEASDEALLTDLLASFGVMVGMGPYFRLGGGVQQPRLNVLVVGDTARGRKGAARDAIKRLTRDADFTDDMTSWQTLHYLKGLTSGEGLVTFAEQGDGRVLVIEGEFARLLTAASREGNTMSSLIRDAYDENHLTVHNKNSPVSTHKAYVGIIANVTQGELMMMLNGRQATEAFNGVGNRFLIIAARRTHLIPTTAIPDAVVAKASTDLFLAVKRARRIEEMYRNAKANDLWAEFYYGQAEPEGLLGAMTARLDVHALRLSMVYALLDGSKTITTSHAEAAFEVVRYAEDSARYVIGDQTGNPIADAILRALRTPNLDVDPPTATTELSRTAVFKLFSNKLTGDEFNAAVALLERTNLIEVEEVRTRGRPKTILRALGHGKEVK